MKENILYKGKYFYIQKEERPGRKTPILRVTNNSGAHLGEIKWYGAWRKFCFFPANETIWDDKCLEDLVSFVRRFNIEWRKSR